MLKERRVRKRKQTPHRSLQFGPVGERVEGKSAYRSWVEGNREHIRWVLDMHSSRKQLEHEQGCDVCQEGVRLAKQSLSKRDVDRVVAAKR